MMKTPKSQFQRILQNSLFVSIYVLFLSCSAMTYGQDGIFTMESVKSYPFPSSLTSAASGAKIAWTFNEEGLRNIYVAEGPDFKARRLTEYLKDDGQEISSLSISPDGAWCVFIRGGDFGSNWDDALPVNPTFDPNPPKVQIWSIAFAGGEPKLLGDGQSPVISPNSNVVAFVKSGQIYTVPIDGSKSPERLFTARGRNGSPKWSPDGTRLAFQSSREGHSFIGVYRNQDTPVQWIDPSFNRDNSPRWSPDGTRLCFIRRPGSGGAPESILESSHSPWAIRTTELSSGKTKELWKAPHTLRGSYPSAQGGTNLHWATDRIVFLSYQDGWQHLYSIPENGGEALLLTPGEFMTEYISLSSDGKWLVFCANTGDDPLDQERRHVARVPVHKAEMEVMTPGEGLEWTPVVTGDGNYLVYIGATSLRPPLPVAMNLSNRNSRLIAEDLIPKNLPTREMVTPTRVIFNAPDGTPVHATMFNMKGGPDQKPAIIYVHGGPPRQMLLGWHYSSYYSNAYAVNQYLASRGFVVLSVNYRLGIGYGYKFHRPPDGGTRGASEYQDIKAAGEWLAKQSFIDPAKIGIYGGSYGGYLTAMALGRNSDLFAAGVDIHGVHDRTINRGIDELRAPDRYEQVPDAERAIQVAWESSPVSDVETWTSPVLIIHADDDRNVAFSQSTDLVQRLLKKGVPVETLVIVDDTHHFMMHSNQVKVNNAIVEYLIRMLK